MFTFSFGSALAVGPTQASNVKTKVEVLTYAEKAYNDALKALEDAAKKAFGTFDKDGYVKVDNKLDVSTKAFEKALATDTKYQDAKKALKAEYDRVVGNINTAASNAKFEGFEDGVENGSDEYPGYNKKDASAVAVPTEAQGAIQLLKQGTESYTYQFSFELKANPTVIDSTKINNAAAVAEFKILKSAAIEAVGAIVTKGVYSEEPRNNSDNMGRTDREVADNLITTALDALNKVALTAETVDGALTGITAIKEIYTAPAGEAKASGKLYEGGAVTGGTPNFGSGLNAIPKIANQENVVADLTYAQNKVLNEMLTNLTKQKDNVVDTLSTALRNERDAKKPDTDKIASLTKDMADVESAYQDAVAAVTYLVKYTKKVSELGGFTGTGGAWQTTAAKWAIDAAALKDTLVGFRALTITAGTYEGTVPAPTALTVATTEEMAVKVAAAEKQAANDKAYLNLDGSYAVQIDKALADAKEDIYTKNVNSYASPTNTTELDDRKVELVMNKSGKVVVNGTQYKTVKAWKAYADAVGTYEKDQFDEIRALVAETKAAIKDAKTIADAEAAFLAGNEKMNAIPTALSHKNAFTLKTGALTDKFDKNVEHFKEYVTAKDQALTNLKTRDNYDFKVAALQEYFTAKWAGEFYKSIYTVEQLDAKYAEAVAVVDNLKTKAELKTQYDAVAATLNALPAAATLADKEAVKAARKAYDEYADYVEMIGASNVFATTSTYAPAYNKLDNAEKAVASAERKAIADIYKTLPAVNKITVADAKNVEAIRTMIDSYVADRVKKDATNTDIDALYAQAIGGGANLAKFENNGGYEEAVVKAYAEVAYDLISKLSIDPVDPAAVKAARAAYDAIPDYLFSGYDIAPYGVGIKAYDKLVALEKVVAANTSVTSLKLNASSKAKKGSITVKWTVKGDASVAEGYQVWKSTKANKGYKKAITTKKTSYKNTKGLKKGTRYYYKVRAYATAADGTIMYSDWSNKAYRKAK